MYTLPWKVCQEFSHTSPWPLHGRVHTAPGHNTRSAPSKALGKYRGRYMKFYQATEGIQQTWAVALLIKMRKNGIRVSAACSYHQLLVLFLSLLNCHRRQGRGDVLHKYEWYQPYEEAESSTFPESPIHLVLQIHTLNFNLSTIYKNTYRHKRA